MKKALLYALTFILLLSAVSMPCFATQEENTEITYLEDGSYFVTTVTEQQVTRATRGGQKSIGYYSSSGVLQWTFVVTGTFTYTPGVSCTCISASSEVQISDSNWSCKTKSASPSGNHAIGSAEVIYVFLLVTIKTIPVSLTLTCDTNGNFS